MGAGPSLPRTTLALYTTREVWERGSQCGRKPCIYSFRACHPPLSAACACPDSTLPDCRMSASLATSPATRRYRAREGRTDRSTTSPASSAHRAHENTSAHSAPGARWMEKIGPHQATFAQTRVRREDGGHGER
ncbi:hypothetical protein C8Q74DRAFT_737306 [Fomes fomentarius]|nr:hypothetical protein C8Q74DRAFT_737306 [Fomes fomentarius]